MSNWHRLAFFVVCTSIFVLAWALRVDAVQTATTPAGGGNTQPAVGSIKIGNLTPLTGPNNGFGLSTEKGIRLAAEERNKAGGILGRPVEIVIGDSRSDPRQAQAAVRKLIEEDKVAAILGDVSSANSIAVGPVCQEARIPLLTPFATNPKVTTIGDYVFRACVDDRFQAALLAKFCAEDLKAKRVACLIDVRNDYSVGLMAVFNEEFPKRGGEIVNKERYESGVTDFKMQLTNIKNANPDAVFLPGYYMDVAPIVRQARELGLGCPFIGGDGWDSPELLKAGGKAVEGCYFFNHYDPGDPDPKVVEFIKSFKTRFDGEIPDGNATLGYDAANLMFTAIERAKSTEGAAIRDALSKTKDFPAVTGNITMGPDRNPIKPGVIIQIKDGKFAMSRRVNP